MKWWIAIVLVGGAAVLAFDIKWYDVTEWNNSNESKLDGSKVVQIKVKWWFALLLLGSAAFSSPLSLRCWFGWCCLLIPPSSGWCWFHLLLLLGGAAFPPLPLSWCCFGWCCIQLLGWCCLPLPPLGGAALSFSLVGGVAVLSFWNLSEMFFFLKKKSVCPVFLLFFFALLAGSKNRFSTKNTQFQTSCGRFFFPFSVSRFFLFRFFFSFHCFCDFFFWACFLLFMFFIFQIFPFFHDLSCLSRVTEWFLWLNWTRSNWKDKFEQSKVRYIEVKWWFALLPSSSCWAVLPSLASLRWCCRSSNDFTLNRVPKSDRRKKAPPKKHEGRKQHYPKQRGTGREGETAAPTCFRGTKKATKGTCFPDVGQFGLIWSVLYVTVCCQNVYKMW